MIAVEQALSHIRNCVSTGSPKILHIKDALGCVLAKDVISKIDLPPFRQSAMDGFAVRLWEDDIYTIKGEIQAGSNKEISLDQGEAVRIYTGAPVPSDADKVIMKEHVEDLHSHMQVKVTTPIEKTNIKVSGEQVKRGEIALSDGTILNSAALSFLASLGVEIVTVYQKPKVAVLISGNELLQAGTPWEPAKIYDSNTYIFNFLLNSAGIEDFSFHYVKDNDHASIAMVGELLKNSDFVLASGGISVGDYDLMRMAFGANGVEELFYKINQRPGKPIFFGLKNDKVIFGLPGNPAACFINFQIYVLPALRRRMGLSGFHLKKGVSKQRIVNTSNKALFLRGTCVNGHLEAFENQSSSMLKSLIDANVLLYIPENVNTIEIGDEVQYVDIVQ